MTEEEAKTKWCPFARDTVTAYRVVTLIGGQVGMHTQCLASACMAWRRSPLGTRTDPDWRSDGYCGLAGDAQ